MCCYCNVYLVPRLDIFESWWVPKLPCSSTVLGLHVFNMGASYSASLFVASNFKSLEIMHCPLLWMTEIRLVLEPSRVPDLSRFMAHKLSVHGPFGMLVLLLLPLLLLLLLSKEQAIQVSLSSARRGRSPNYFLDEVGASHAG